VIQKSSIKGSQGIFVGSTVGKGELIKVAVALGRTITTVAVASGNATTFGTGAQDVIMSMERLKKINGFITNIFLFRTHSNPTG
jgi:hypothetical protein